MPTPNERTVTARKLFDAIQRKSDYGYDGDDEFRIDFIDEEATLQEFERLLSQARQEARREALREMDEAWNETCVGIGISHPYCVFDTQNIHKLRQEYSNQP